MDIAEYSDRQVKTAPYRWQDQALPSFMILSTQRKAELGIEETQAPKGSYTDCISCMVEKDGFKKSFPSLNQCALWLKVSPDRITKAINTQGKCKEFNVYKIDEAGDVVTEAKSVKCYEVTHEKTGQKYYMKAKYILEVFQIGKTAIQFYSDSGIRIKGCYIIHSVHSITENIDYDLLDQNDTKKSKKSVIVIYANGTKKRFTSITEVSKDVGYAFCTIKEYLKTGNKTKNGVRFEYALD